MNFRELFKGALKIAIAMFLAVLALGVFGGLVWKAIDYREKEAAKQYEVPKDWSLDLTKNLQMRLRAKTKLVEGKLFGSVIVEGYPAFLSEPPLSVQNSQGRFTLSFMDKDGFKLFEKDVPLSAMKQVVGPNGKVGGLDYQFSEYTGVSDYPKFARLEVGWNFNIEMPKTANPPAPVNANSQDHCAPNLTRAERLRRLALNGTVRETGYGEFTAGDKSIVLSEGTVISCR